MNLKIFEYLLALDKYKNFGRASAACGVSQPALSTQIKKFEENIKVKVLERNSRNFMFTEAGKDILKRAEIVIKDVNQIYSLAEMWNDPYSGRVTIGAFPTLAPYIFPQVANDLIDCYSELKFFLVEEKTNVLVNRLLAGDLDAAFLATPEEHSGLKFEPLFTEEFLLAVPLTHKWVDRESIDTNELISESLMLLEEGHCLRGQALEFCQSAGAGESLDFRASSLNTLIQMIAMGNGITLVPECAALPNPQIKYIRFANTAPSREIALFWRSESVRDVLFEEIADDIRRSYKKLKGC